MIASGKKTIVPETLKVGFGRMLRQSFGFVLIVFAVALLLSLISHSNEDTSWNVATTGNGAINNWLGGVGAYLSDFLLQIFGGAAVLLCCVVGIWGWHILRRGYIPHLRMLSIQASLGVVLCSCALALSIPNEAKDPNELHEINGLFAHGTLAVLGTPLWTLPVLLCVGACGLVLVLRSFALTRGQWAAVGGLMERGFGAAVDAGGVAGRTLGKGIMHSLRRSPQVRERLRPPRSDTLRPVTWLDRILIQMRSALASVWNGFVKALTLLLTSLNRLDEDAVHRDTDLPQMARRSKEGGSNANTRTGDGSPASEKGRAYDVGARSQQNTKNEARLSSGLQVFELPPLDLLYIPDASRVVHLSEDELSARGRELMQVMTDFGVKGELVGIKTGPVVSLFEFEPARGVKTQRVIRLADDIARAMRALSVRVAVVPGESVIGIELPNPTRETVFLREVLDTPDFTNASLSLPIALGKSITGKPIIANLARMPHLLVAGTTGAGKSVGLNCMILSLLQKLPPEQCRMLMIDPKMLELSIYNGIPHLLTPVVTDPKKAVGALKWAVREMEDRYRALSQVGARNIEGYNERVCEARAKGEALKRTVQTGFDAETGRPVYEEQVVDLIEFPHIVVIVDEMADLMMVAGKEIEAAIQRLSQMARAAGIHLIMATQRPSVDVITGTIKANFPSRISFRVISKFDSRTILGEEGAEQLLGQGDMLFQSSGTALTRVHGPFVTEQEVEKVVEWLRAQSSPVFLEDLFEDLESGNGDGDDSVSGERAAPHDELYDEAVALVTRENRASTSFVQRKLQIGYNRAARLIEAMEQEGIIGGPDHVGRRKVLAPPPPSISTDEN